ncbi:MAG: type II secretion system protein N [Candidatus Omnitrophica bacterium]|nr:type II secretion system protein N [Candidatus Omnitrophota bacterium]
MEKDSKSPTPEKELLNLIETHGPARQGASAAIKHQGFSLFSLGALRGRFSFFRHRIKGGFKIPDFSQIDIKLVNVALQFIIFILLVYFVASLINSVISLQKGFEVKISAAGKEDKATQTISFLKTASYYLEKARERDIFTMGTKKISQMVTGKPSISKVMEETKDLRLVGISWSNDPDVMIEDTQNKRTLFLKKGQLIDNKIKLKSVFKDKVILSYAGEEIELR